MKKSFFVEYLVITKHDDTFCGNEDTFLSLLGVDTSLQIERAKSEIVFKNKKKKIVVSYQLDTDVVPGKHERFFKLRLSIDDEQKLEEFEALTFVLVKIFNKIQEEVSINVLWNDIAREYAVEGYRLINEVENLLRRLISSFMLINVGFDWVKLHIPEEVEKRGPDLKTNYSDYLHQTYFSDLKTILFEGQRDNGFRNIGEIQRFVEKCISDNKTTISVQDLQGVISKSLWERHFASTSNYSKQDFEKDLDSLNGLRNEIAHCRNVTREALGRIQNLSRKLIKTLRLEIEKLPEIKLTKEEKDFQIYSEMARYVSERQEFSGAFSEWSVANYYKTQFGEDSVIIQSNKALYPGIDIIVNPENLGIGIQVRPVSSRQFAHITSRMIQNIDLDQFVPKSVEFFREYHLVIVLREHEPSAIAKIYSSIERLCQFFANLHHKIKLILGAIDSKYGFQEISLENAIFFRHEILGLDAQ